MFFFSNVDELNEIWLSGNWNMILEDLKCVVCFFISVVKKW